MERGAARLLRNRVLEVDGHGMPIEGGESVVGAGASTSGDLTLNTSRMLPAIFDVEELVQYVSVDGTQVSGRYLIFVSHALLFRSTSSMLVRTILTTLAMFAATKDPVVVVRFQSRLGEISDMGFGIHREVLDRAVFIPDCSSTRSPTKSIRTIKSMTGTTSSNPPGNDSVFTVYVPDPPLDELTDIQFLPGSSADDLLVHLSTTPALWTMRQYPLKGTCTRATLV